MKKKNQENNFFHLLKKKVHFFLKLKSFSLKALAGSLSCAYNYHYLINNLRLLFKNFFSLIKKGEEFFVLQKFMKIIYSFLHKPLTG
jgi:hypothetical protein